MKTRRTPGPRLTRLERLARERPCPQCGRTHRPHDPSAPAADPARLSAAERRELCGLIAAGTGPPCARCGRAARDIARLTDDQKRRSLRPLRALFGRPGAIGGPR